MANLSNLIPTKFSGYTDIAQKPWQKIEVEFPMISLVLYPCTKQRGKEEPGIHCLYMNLIAMAFHHFSISPFISVFVWHHYIPYPTGTIYNIIIDTYKDIICAHQISSTCSIMSRSQLSNYTGGRYLVSSPDHTHQGRERSGAPSSNSWTRRKLPTSHVIDSMNIIMVTLLIPMPCCTTHDR